MRFFTSDLHMGHARIIELCNRPFKDVDHMDAEIADRWNGLVTPDDTVFILGDLALGPIDKSLDKVAALNGSKIIVLGNHDRPFMRKGKHDEDKWIERYRRIGHVTDSEMASVGGHTVLMSHFPYVGDSHDDDRFESARLADEGVPLLHGHTHASKRLTRSPKGTVQIHVGMDAWNFTPVPEPRIESLLGWVENDRRVGDTE